MNTVPIILCIGGQDPTGGAGIQADIETVAALGGHALTLASALTAQDSHNILAVHPTTADFFSTQLETLMDDIQPTAVKIGLLGSTELVAVLVNLLHGFDGPVVLDPVLAAGGGFDLDAAGLGPTIVAELLPRTTLLTPNRAEARRLSGCEESDEAAQWLLRAGAGAVLMTGADEAEGRQVMNRLFMAAGRDRSFEWPRLPHRYHGSGCTLASACATRLALGDDLATAAERAQQFTWQALRRAIRPGGGQWLPRRQT
jgi:hydroxymethylpyrimidine/phosphomethylpyrimidine kinase